jgi:type IV secretion system protein TrbF
MLNSLLAHARGAADRFLDGYYHSDNLAHNPFKLAEKLTISVQIDSILSVSSQSYQLRWTEQHDLNGVVIGAPTHWEAELQTQIIPPASDDAIISNPLGFFVTQISWTEQQLRLEGR